MKERPLNDEDEVRNRSWKGTVMGWDLELKLQWLHSKSPAFVVGAH